MHPVLPGIGPTRMADQAAPAAATVDDRPCSSCGAHNRAEADHCWQCYASFRPRSTGHSRVLQGINRSPTSVPLPAPHDPTSWKNVFSDMNLHKWARLAVAMGLIAVGGITGLLYRLDSFPDTVDGYEQIKSPATEDEVERRFEEIIPYDDVNMEVALYGNEAGEELKYAIYTLDLPAGMSLKEYAAPSGTQGSMLLINLLTRDFTCQAYFANSMCGWRDGQDVTAVGGFGTLMSDLKHVTRDVRSEMRG